MSRRMMSSAQAAQKCSWARGTRTRRRLSPCFRRWAALCWQLSALLASSTTTFGSIDFGLAIEDLPLGLRDKTVEVLGNLVQLYPRELAPLPLAHPNRGVDAPVDYGLQHDEVRLAEVPPAPLPALGTDAPPTPLAPGLRPDPRVEAGPESLPLADPCSWKGPKLLGPAVVFGGDTVRLQHLEGASQFLVSAEGKPSANHTCLAP